LTDQMISPKSAGNWW